MGLERISDYFQANPSRRPLQRIFVAEQMRQKIKSELDEEVAVVVRASKLVVNCQTSAQGAGLRRQTRQLYQLLKQIAPAEKLTVTIRVVPTTGQRYHQGSE